MRYWPRLSVVALPTRTPRELVAVTVAPGMTAPEGSVMVPDKAGAVVAAGWELSLRAGAALPKEIAEVNATLTARPFHGEEMAFQFLPSSLLKKRWLSVSMASRWWAREAIERMAR